MWNARRGSFMKALRYERDVGKAVAMDISPKAFPAAVPGGSLRTYLGHELVGEVVEVGAEVEGLAPGERIAQRIEYSRTPDRRTWPRSIRERVSLHS
jgi:hypothetical protein